MSREFCLVLAAVLVVAVSGCDKQPSPAPAPAQAPAKPGTASSSKSVEPQVMRIVAKQMGVPPSDLTRGTHLRKDLKADDLDVVELVMELEDTFSITIADEDADRFQTLGEVTDYVRARVKR
jgi:acyl carrier protein